MYIQIWPQYDCLQVCLKYYEHEFVELACQCPSVVVCRCSPTQKADIVKLLQNHTGKRTCSIGNAFITLINNIVKILVLCSYILHWWFDQELKPLMVTDIECPRHDCSLTIMFHDLWSAGDGGNDVSMIQAANVGVGIVGKVSIHQNLSTSFVFLRVHDT